MTESNTPLEVSSLRLPIILCVDDEPNILSALKRLFRGKGWHVRSAAGGQAALASMESEAVDLVISDMRMPEMDGAQFLAQVPGATVPLSRMPSGCRRRLLRISALDKPC